MTDKPKPFWEQVMDTVPAQFGAAMERASHGAEPACICGHDGKLTSADCPRHGAEPAKGAGAVPREPTQAMIDYAANATGAYIHTKAWDEQATAIYQAMYDAARASPIKAEVTTTIDATGDDTNVVLASPVTTGDADLLREIDRLTRGKTNADWRDLVALLDRCCASIAANASLRAKLEERDADAERWGKLVGQLYMAGAQSDRELFSECCPAFKITFPDGAPFATLRQSAQAASQPSNPET